MKGKTFEGTEMRELWSEEGIVYSEDRPYKLQMKIQNLTDVLFTAIFQASAFGNEKTDMDGMFGSAVVYQGILSSKTNQIEIGKESFSAGIEKLADCASNFQSNGKSFMRVGSVDKKAICGHAENIDVEKFLKLAVSIKTNPRAIPNGLYPIGYRNYIHLSTGKCDFIMIRKSTDYYRNPKFEFETDIGSIEVYEYEINFDKWASPNLPGFQKG
ncbi:MAG: hypothetical protein LBI56_02095 [Puniceicoccales bacterium]|nr:hypothetical protein [Puniceicoccales bacterium]